MADDPFYLQLLEKLGFNVTKLRWRIYAKEQKRSANTGGGFRLPNAFNWLAYENKICLNCGAVADRDARVCHRCEHKLPSMLGYRLFRLVGLALPKSLPVVSTIFLVLSMLVYCGAILVQGPSAIMSPAGETLIRFGGLTSARGLANGQWWRLFAFGLAHGGLIHIGFNSFAVSQVGPIVEMNIGRKRMLVVITLCQLGSALATHYWYVSVQGRPYLTIGASGWLFGLIGFGVAYFHSLGDRATALRNALGQWALYGLVFGVMMGANNAAHMGGYATGVVLGLNVHRRGTAGSIIARLWDAAFWPSMAIWGITVLFLMKSIVLSIE